METGVTQSLQFPNRAADARTLLLYVHIPKAGGTSFTDLLAAVYESRFLHVQRRRTLRWPAEYYTRGAANRYLAISGHLPYGFHKRFGSSLPWTAKGGEGVFEGRDLKYISIMRDPVERVKSYYRYVTTTPSHRLHQRLKGLAPAAFFGLIEEIERHGGETRNQQSRMLGRGHVSDPAALWRSIRENFYAVGVLEDVDPFVAHLRRTLGWPDTAGLAHLNKSSSARAGAEFDADTLGWIRRNNAADIELYACVRDEGPKYWKS